MSTFGKFRPLIARFAEDDRGATAIEYGLIVSLVFLAVTAAVNRVADQNNDMYSEITSALN